jgi:heme A synthase
MTHWGKIDKIFSWVGAISSFCLLVLGGYVRATGAGLSCPDWPLCFDRAVPDFSIAGVPQEVGHRYLAFFVSLCIVLVTIATFKSRVASAHRWRVARWMIPVLIAQIILGGLTVLMLLKPLIVTLHLVFGTILVQQFLVLIGMANREKPSAERPKTQKNLSKLLIGGVLLTGAQIALGGFVGSSGLALVCLDIPSCGPALLGTLPQQHIHMAHRILGVVVLGYFLFTTFQGGLWRGIEIGKLQRFAPVFLICIQIGLGVANIWYHVPIPAVLSHLALAQLILAVVINTVIRLR